MFQNVRRELLSIIAPIWYQKDWLWSFEQICQFKITFNHKFDIGGRKFKIGLSGFRTLKALSDLHQLTVSLKIPSRLIAARPLIRQIESCHSRATLCLVAKKTKDPTLRILAIWLRGRCRGSLGTKVISSFAKDKNPRVRREVTRALKRMAGWKTLSDIAANDPDANIRRMAIPSPSRPVGERISEFKRNVAFRKSTRQRKSVFSSFLVTFPRKTAPKSRQFIRTILERIRKLVRQRT